MVAATPAVASVSVAFVRNLRLVNPNLWIGLRAGGTPSNVLLSIRAPSVKNGVAGKDPSELAEVGQ